MSRVFSVLRGLCVSVVIVLPAVVGCSGRADVAIADKSGPRIGLFQGDFKSHERSFDVLGLTPAQLQAIDNLDPADRAAIFQVFVESAGGDAPAILGTTQIEPGTLRFIPRFPLTPGVRYRAVLHAAKLPRLHRGADLVATFEIPKPPPQPPTVIEHIYPTSDHLPENQLKFYIHFSAPMARGEAYDHIHLVGADRNKIEAPFLELGEELWDPAMRRFTLLCDPGRVKRELKPREELGPVLEAGKHYTLVVDRDWHDAAGNPLDKSANKAFEVEQPDETPVDPTGWRIEPPAADSTSDLVVRFPEPLDHSLLERVVWVVDSTGTRVEGRVEVVDGETLWRFKPSRAWHAGDYQLVADTMLEDLAGNAIGRAFDADVFAEVQKRVESQTVTVPFVVR